MLMTSACFDCCFTASWSGGCPCPGGLVLVYALRDVGELQALGAILEAAAWYTTRGELYSVGLGAEHPKTENQNGVQLWGGARGEGC